MGSDNFSVMYQYILTKTLGNSSSFVLPYNFYLIKLQRSNQTNSYFLYFLRVYFFFTFFFKKLASNLYNMILIQIYILVLNTIGIIPYSSTVSSYLSVTLILTLIIIIGAYFMVFSLHGIHFFSLFMPQGCPFILIFFIIPIEFISYVFRLISLSARLFANMMAGHSLLAVLAGFSWGMYNSNSSLLIIAGTIPLLVVFLLFFLETGVAIVQAVVFTILSCMYMDEAVNLSH